MMLLLMLMEKLLGWHDQYIDYHMYLTNLFAIPAVVVMAMGLVEKKKKDYHGQMSFKEGMISGIIISVIIAAFSPLTQWIISYVITPDYFATVIKRSVEIGYFATTEQAQAHFNYPNYAKQSVLGALMMGIITTFVVVLFIRTKKQTES